MQQPRQTLMNNAERAFKQVEDTYAIPSGLPPYLTSPVWQNFHFVEASRWAYYLRYIARFNVQQENAEKVEGVTHSYDSIPKIGINRCYHTFATLVHESIHFFSHYAFRRAFNVDVFEGATEYLTRRLLGESGPRRDIHQQGNIYAHEYALVLSVIHNDKDRQRLCKAYFCGNEKAILQIGLQFKN